jgi:hypothetical protein
LHPKFPSHPPSSDRIPVDHGATQRAVLGLQ